MKGNSNPGGTSLLEMIDIVNLTQEISVTD